MNLFLSTGLLVMFGALSINALAQTHASDTSASTRPATTSQHLGFDRNLYPGDDTLPALHQHFAFSGYWLNNPPGETTSTWRGKRDILIRNGFGFLVLFNGRVDAEILMVKRRGTSPEKLGQ